MRQYNKLVKEKKIKTDEDRINFFKDVSLDRLVKQDDKIISRGYNHRESKNDVSSHAEMEAIRKANKKLKSWRLVDCDIYITLEPCLMCMGALIQSRISHIYYGAKDFKGGALGSSINALDAKNINHYPEVEGGILEEECGQIISNYFKTKRENKK